MADVAPSPSIHRQIVDEPMVSGGSATAEQRVIRLQAADDDDRTAIVSAQE